MKMKLEYMPLSEMVRLPRNPKTHSLKHLGSSMGRFGFTAPPTIDERTGTLVAGHGRIDALKKIRDEGGEPPDRITVNKKGEWMVPIIRGVEFADDREAEAYAIADNRLTEVGGWDFGQLSAIMQDLAAEGDGSLEGLGFEDLELKKLLGMQEDGVSDGKDPEETVISKLIECPSCGHEFLK